MTKRQVVETKAAELTAAGKLNEERELWQKFGREKRPHRVLQGLTDLIARAERSETMTYEQFSSSLRLSSHWERNHILRLIMKCCHDSGWPIYPALVVREHDRMVGDGFFSDLRTLVGRIISPNDVYSEYEKLRDECFNTEIPSAQEIALGFANWSLKNQLH